MNADTLTQVNRVNYYQLCFCRDSHAGLYAKFYQPFSPVVLIQPLDTRDRTDIDCLLLDSVFVRPSRIVDFRLVMVDKSKYVGNIIHAESTTDAGILVNPRFSHFVFLPSA